MAINIKSLLTDHKSNKTINPRVVVLVAGLYPFFHYYSSNLSEATSWQQFLFMFALCFVLPQLLLGLKNLVFKIKFLKPLKPNYLPIYNAIVFGGLIGFLTFFPQKKLVLLCVVIGFVVGFLLKKHLKKVLFIQFLMALMALVSFVPNLIFHINQDNASWAALSEEELDTQLIEKPNIFVIQPDGYVNFSEIDKPPYNYDNSGFENWLTSKGFTNYDGFRSNYYSTLTSNSSMFAMKHHYYSNTSKSTLKTHKANEVIAGDYNNVLKILKNNGYKSFLITDNSYFLIDRIPSKFDYCNVNTTFMTYHNSGRVEGVEILEDFKSTLDTINTKENFFFIEKTLPSHINYRKRYSLGIEGERSRYIQRLEEANQWIRSLVNTINKYDEEALIVIVADHGGQVGMNFTLEILEKKLNHQEAVSTFSSLLSIKWPKSVGTSNLSFKSNVNLFRNLFFALSSNEYLLKGLKDDSSYLPLKNEDGVNFYQYINDKGEVVFEHVQKNK